MLVGWSLVRKVMDGTVGGWGKEFYCWNKQVCLQWICGDVHFYGDLNKLFLFVKLLLLSVAKQSYSASSLKIPRTIKNKLEFQNE